MIFVLVLEKNVEPVTFQKRVKVKISQDFASLGFPFPSLPVSSAQDRSLQRAGASPIWYHACVRMLRSLILIRLHRAASACEWGMLHLRCTSVFLYSPTLDVYCDQIKRKRVNVTKCSCFAV